MYYRKKDSKMSKISNMCKQEKNTINKSKKIT